VFCLLVKIVLLFAASYRSLCIIFLHTLCCNTAYFLGWKTIEKVVQTKNYAAHMWSSGAYKICSVD